MFSCAADSTAMKTLNALFVGFILVCLLAACHPEKKSASSLSSTDPTAEEQVVPGVESESPLYIALQRKWESQPTEDAYTTHAVCAFPSGSISGASKSCTLTVPEGTLYYSKINFLVGTNLHKSCPILTFRPYYYKKSSDANFTPDGHDTDFDCQTDNSTTPKECYGGAAPAMLDKFPQYTGRYFLPYKNMATSFPLGTENSLQTYYGANVNFLVTNDRTNRALGKAAGPGAHIANSFRDYTVTCENYWGDVLFDILLTIKDENTESEVDGVTLDSFTDWDNI